MSSIFELNEIYECKFDGVETLASYDENVNWKNVV